MRCSMNVPEKFSLLSDLKIGRTARVVKFCDPDSAEALRLQNLGLNRGSCVEVLNRQSQGPLLVKVGDARIALNQDVGRLIKVIAS